jgi:hypothetical protein
MKVVASPRYISNRILMCICIYINGHIIHLGDSGRRHKTRLLVLVVSCVSVSVTTYINGVVCM